MLHALGRFFRTPPLALRIVLGVALAIEALGFCFGIVPLGPIVRDAVHAGSARIVTGTLLFAAGVCAIHLVLAAITMGAALLARRVPWLAAILAIAPLALASLGFRGAFGFAVATRDIQLAQDAPLALIEAAAGHVAFAALASVIVLVAIPFGLIRRGGAEGGRPASNGDAS